jgi:phosphopantothenate---cysteine ligase (CTP)
MNCIVTAGPTYESMDRVRRLTNFSTGRLGTGLANFLRERGHEVTLLIGEQATYPGERRAQNVATFTTTQDLGERLQAAGAGPVDAVFHAAAVSDFTFGKIWSRSADGVLTEITAGKISTRAGILMAELVPTPKIILHLRDWFPTACLVGWKYEMDGGRDDALRAAECQMAESRTDACVVNGAAYGAGFGVLSRDRKCEHLAEMPALFEVLARFVN